MPRDFYDENFEWFLRRNAESFRMKASDKVWSKISKELNRRRRRINFTLAASFLLLTGLGYYFVTHSVKELPVTNQIVQTSPSPAAEQAVPKNELPTAAEMTPVMKEAPASRKVSAADIAANVGKQSFPPIVTITKTEQTPAVDVDNTSANIVSAKTDVAPIDIAIATVGETEKIQAAKLVEDINAADLAINKLEGLSETENSSPADNPSLAAALSESADNMSEAVATNVSVRKKKLDWQIALTPTISYRKLGENKSYMRTGGSFSQPTTLSPFYNVNNAVTHKPDLGFELGVTAKYKITNGIRLMGGVQFNVNRYDIKAFNAPYALTTIRLNNGNSVSSLNTVSGYSTTAGYTTDWLKNLYFQVSAPVGVELRLKGNEKMHFGVATSIQPSYLLGDRAYLLTADYKNYVRVPWLVRRWNANTNFQTFVSYSTGKMRWQVGPQVRYQLLSSFVTEYPVKENLFDFGMKIGISLGKD